MRLENENLKWNSYEFGLDRSSFTINSPYYCRRRRRCRRRQRRCKSLSPNVSPMTVNILVCFASEIENQSAFKERTDLMNGDEEARFAAVERSQLNSPDEVKVNAGKYVAPEGCNSTQAGKLIRPAVPLVSNG